MKDFERCQRCRQVVAFVLRGCASCSGGGGNSMSRRGFWMQCIMYFRCMTPWAIWHRLMQDSALRDPTLFSFFFTASCQSRWTHIYNILLMSVKCCLKGRSLNQADSGVSVSQRGVSHIWRWNFLGSWNRRLYVGLNASLLRSVRLSSRSEALCCLSDRWGVQTVHLCGLWCLPPPPAALYEEASPAPPCGERGNMLLHKDDSLATEKCLKSIF